MRMLTSLRWRLFVGVLMLPVVTSEVIAADAELVTEATVLVARPNVAPPFDHTVVLVGPIRGDRHIGVIVNRPTTLTLGAMFPDNEVSRRVQSPVHAGGPTLENALFVVVHAAAPPDSSSIELSGGLYLVSKGATVDTVIARNPAHVRYVLGVMAWGEGELFEEMLQGA